MSLSSEDLGNGYLLVFQKHVASGQVRAVVKDEAGAIVARGPVVLEAKADQSKRAAVLEFMTRKIVTRVDDVDDPEVVLDDEMDIDEEDEDEGDDEDDTW